MECPSIFPILNERVSGWFCNPIHGGCNLTFRYPRQVVSQTGNPLRLMAFNVPFSQLFAEERLDLEHMSTRDYSNLCKGEAENTC